VVHEFIASLEVTGVIGHLISPTIRFCLFNNDHFISVNTLRQLLGFYNRDDQIRHWFRRLKWDFGDLDTPRIYWACIARPGVDWSGSRVMGSHITREDLRVVRRVIAHSWGGRRGNYAKVYKA